LHLLVEIGKERLLVVFECLLPRVLLLGDSALWKCSGGDLDVGLV
jgi:hypothetical protein